MPASRGIRSAKPKRLSKKQHRERHQLLHQHFDELMADFLYHHKDKLPSDTTLEELMIWSHQQTIDPDD
jgi:hypothetical protein